MQQRRIHNDLPAFAGWDQVQPDYMKCKQHHVMEQGNIKWKGRNEEGKKSESAYCVVKCFPVSVFYTQVSGSATHMYSIHLFFETQGQHLF